MINKVLNYVTSNKILTDGDSVLLGVSGGADSICLLSILNQLKTELNLHLSVVHINHHIRGGEADKDALFVKSVCSKMGIDFRLKEIDVKQLAVHTATSEEEAGRNARYEIFYRIAEEIGANRIAVAHNLNDNSETILFHLFRGTGIRGLTGIPVQRDMIIRPLLCCSREEIEHYLLTNKIKYRVDSTNHDTKYSRNKIRLELLPYIRENINEKAEYNIVNAAKNLNMVNDYMEQQIKEASRQYVKGDTLLGEGFGIHEALLCGVIRLLIKKECGKLKDITHKHIDAVIALKDMPVSKKVNLPYGLTAERTYEGIKVTQNIDIKKNFNGTRNKKESLFKEEILIRDGEIMTNPTIHATMECNGLKREDIKELPYTKWFDYDKINRLTLRTRREGDFFTIGVNGGKKKLKDYMIDEKIPRDKRDEVLLVADGSHIVWIVGYRISSYYKVTDETKKILRLDFTEVVNL